MDAEYEWLFFKKVIKKKYIIIFLKINQIKHVPNPSDFF